MKFINIELQIICLSYRLYVFHNCLWILSYFYNDIWLLNTIFSIYFWRCTPFYFGSIQSIQLKEVKFEHARLPVVALYWQLNVNTDVYGIVRNSFPLFLDFFFCGLLHQMSGFTQNLTIDILHEKGLFSSFSTTQCSL